MREEQGVALGYGGIWCPLIGTSPTPKTPAEGWRYKWVLTKDDEDKPHYSDTPEMIEEKYKRNKQKYVIDGCNLYKLVNPSGRLNPRFNGIDPITGIKE